jgi:hypothetical protein
MLCKERLGTGWAGVLMTFPSMSLTLLVLTSLERGPDAAIRMGQVLPLGNLSMIAFLVVFGVGSPAYGLAGGTFAAVLAALAPLPGVAWWTRRAEVLGDISSLAPRPHVSLSRRRGDRAHRFSPRFEALA